MRHYLAVDEMLTTGEVARLLGVDPGTVRRWSGRGVVKAYRVGPGGRRRYRREDVAVLLLERAGRRYAGVRPSIR